MRLVSAAEVRDAALRVLTIPTTSSPDSDEAIAALVRRSASFLAPCTSRALREHVVSSRRGLEVDDAAFTERVTASIDSLRAYGDLLELPAREGEGGGALLYLAPLGFVRRASGTLFLIGIAPDGAAALPGTLADRLQHVRHTRRLTPLSGENLPQLLRQLGYSELPEALWRKRPRTTTAQALVAEFESRLLASEIRGTLDNLLVLDPERSVRYYRGRWVAPNKLTGHFVARRDQRFGSQLWSCVALEAGAPTHLVDIGPEAGRSGADRAWHLQMAIDAVRGISQQFTPVADEREGIVHLRFYSPVPQWAQQRWELLGERADAKGCLFAYAIPAREYPQERDVLTTHLWLQESP